MSRHNIQIGNPTLMRETNSRTVLNILRAVGACSRADLVRETGMSAPTIANVISDFSDRGLIKWVGEGVSGGGRRPENLCFNSGYGYFAGVTIMPDAIRILLTDLTGNLLEERSRTLPLATRDPDSCIEVLCQSLREIMQNLGLPWKKLLAVTVGVAGITNVRDGVVLSVSAIPSWRRVALRELIKKRLDCTVHIENRTNLGAIGEHSFGVAQSEENFIFVSIGRGVGAGIFVNGEIVHGANWSAGEIGYLQIPNIVSAQPSLYNMGRLEQVLGAAGILRSWRAVSKRADAEGNIRTAVDVLDLAHSGNPAAKKIALQRARLLKDVVLNLSLTLNPSLFIFGGDLGVHPALLEPVAELLQQSEFAKVRVIPCSLGPRAAVWGAIAVAMRASEMSLYRS